MNKVFKVVWSATKNAYVVTSELAKSHQKTATTIVAAILLSASLGGGIASASTPADWYRTDLIGSQKWLTPGQGSQAVEQQPIDLHNNGNNKTNNNGANNLKNKALVRLLLI